MSDTAFNQNFYCKVKIKDIYLVPENIISLVIREWYFDFIPRIECTFNDEGLFSELYLLDDNDKVEVLIAKDKNSEAFLTANFSIQSETQSQTHPVDKFRLVETTLETLSDAPITLNHSFISKPIGSIKETTYRSFSPYVTYSMGQDDLYIVGSRRKEIQSQGDHSV